ncbi:unnamed protein product [Paramecium pentaurelia]|uniref:UDP-glucose 6-dehydrogenase n=1 Tax=Paramecium pentaurelia TaxID=43138 RepID=A0A8S1XSM4_9CILI|nr:unnamed protein product [Paramecium pentaurelia]
MQINKVCCFGAGYVGGPTMAVMASKCPKQTFVVYDINEQQINKWNNKQYPVYEKNLDEYINQTLDNNLIFTCDIDIALKDCDIAFLAVNTPSKKYGLGAESSLDISYIDSCLQEIKKYPLTKKLILVEKSTVPIKTCDYINAVLKDKNICVLSNPEFLAEGTAIQDLLNPDRVIIGGAIEYAQQLASLYEQWVPKEKIIFTNIYSAELSKIVANSFLAQRVSSINSISIICDKIGADVNEISQCVGSDSRIGNKFLKTSVGFGGSCLKKDLLCLIYLCESLQLDEVAQYWRQVYLLNEFQKQRFYNLIITSMFNSLRNKIIVILGVTFKANTNDTRESASLMIIQKLQEEQAILRIYDPQGKIDKLEQYQNLDGIFQGASAIVILTEWEEFTKIDYAQAYDQMAKPSYCFDGRNLLQGDIMKSLGFLYYGLGRI